MFIVLILAMLPVTHRAKHQIIHSKYVQIILCQLSLNRDLKLNFKKEAMELKIKIITTENKTIDGFKHSHRRKYH